MRYTYSDDEYGSDSKRNSETSTPLETGPTVTASGRQVKARVGGAYGESMLIDQRKELEKATGEGNFTETSEDMPTTTPTGRGVRVSRSGRQVKPVRAKYGDEMDSESEEAQSSGKEWSGNEDEPDESEPDFDAEDEDDEEEEMSDGGVEADEPGEDDNTQESLVVQLRYRKGKDNGATAEIQPRPPAPSSLSQPAANGDAINGIPLTQNEAPRAQEPSEAIKIDTLDMAPRMIQLNGTPTLSNGDLKMENTSSPAPQAPVYMPVQPMDVS